MFFDLILIQDVLFLKKKAAQEIAFFNLIQKVGITLIQLLYSTSLMPDVQFQATITTIS